MIGEGLLGKLYELQGKKAKITYTDGEVIICKPLQYLEEEYESYIVEVLEPSLNFSLGQLLEVEEVELQAVEEVTEK